MTAEARRGRYSTVAIFLHWLIAAAIVLQVILGWRMGGRPTPEHFAVFQLHKSVGITILLLSLIRLGWRLAHRPPPLPAAMAAWEKTLSKITNPALRGDDRHAADRLADRLDEPIAVPTLSTGRSLAAFPLVSDLAPGAKHLWNVIGLTRTRPHWLVGPGLLALHVAGALKHSCSAGTSPYLRGMARPFRPRPDPRLLAILLAFGGVAAFGTLVQLPARHGGASRRLRRLPRRPRSCRRPLWPHGARHTGAATPATPAESTDPVRLEGLTRLDACLHHRLSGAPGAGPLRPLEGRHPVRARAGSVQ